jgi:hypothetical protein
MTAQELINHLVAFLNFPNKKEDVVCLVCEGEKGSEA